MTGITYGLDCGQHQGIIAGQAFTEYVCEECKQEHTHPNTAVPKLCGDCSRDLGQCARCRTPVPPAQETPEIT